MSTTLTPYLSFDGKTREAFAFYAQVLDARIETMLSYDDMPTPPTDAEGCGGGPLPTGEGIMHGCLELPGGAMLMASDVPPGMPYNGINGAMLALQFDTVAQAEAAFGALAEGGTVVMPLAPSFWTRIFGMVTDRFGVAWAINGESIPFGQA